MMVILTNLPHFWQAALQIADKECVEWMLDHPSPDPVVETVLGRSICCIVALSE